MKIYEQNLRLTEDEIKAIKEIAKEIFGKGVKVWIFGSRADPNKKGGDIDIYIEIPNFEKTDIFDKKVKYLVNLEEKIGEQKIDLIIAPYDCKKFYCLEAKNTGIRIL
ncbi:nucleotidyltransferase domain-containing protein [Hydrogenivirga sp. 128-5-R1-1]|uniref:nucleotidyltransferase domain-containing protein n=1 Tax=Hydrogenivirga sp. 128-5-R1-1 TaxID=392423 RepID=UPI00015F0962|nr:nucleotidyltransferase domain-containing protein [Hydrogenivirga sp. 128-5-R1-1]EDP73620.1 hypothetical protein HG1285_09201 [Hydrogenivirga sp. 128-5-R1-1]